MDWNKIRAVRNYFKFFTDSVECETCTDTGTKGIFELLEDSCFLWKILAGDKACVDIFQNNIEDIFEEAVFSQKDPSNVCCFYLVNPVILSNLDTVDNILSLVPSIMDNTVDNLLNFITDILYMIMSRYDYSAFVMEHVEKLLPRLVHRLGCPAIKKLMINICSYPQALRSMKNSDLPLLLYNSCRSGGTHCVFHLYRIQDIIENAKDDSFCIMRSFNAEFIDGMLQDFFDSSDEYFRAQVLTIFVMLNERYRSFKDDRRNNSEFRELMPTLDYLEKNNEKILLRLYKDVYVQTKQFSRILELILRLVILSEWSSIGLDIIRMFFLATFQMIRKSSNANNTKMYGSFLNLGIFYREKDSKSFILTVKECGFCDFFSSKHASTGLSMNEKVFRQLFIDIDYSLDQNEKTDKWNNMIDFIRNTMAFLSTGYGHMNQSTDEHPIQHHDCAAGGVVFKESSSAFLDKSTKDEMVNFDNDSDSEEIDINDLHEQIIDADVEDVENISHCDIPGPIYILKTLTELVR